MRLLCVRWCRLWSGGASCLALPKALAYPWPNACKVEPQVLRASCFLACVNTHHYAPLRVAARVTPSKVHDDDRLLECTKALVEIAARTEELKAFVLPTYLPDLMAALLQLAYGPSAGSAPPLAPAGSAPPDPAKATPASVLSSFLPPSRTTGADQALGSETSPPASPAQRWAFAVLEGSLTKTYFFKIPHPPPLPHPLVMSAASMVAFWMFGRCGTTVWGRRC
jgi:hypothetical protein